MRYAVVTPVRNEEENLRRLAAAMERQTLPPARWLIVDTGSTDATVALARSLPGAEVLSSAGAAVATRGGPIVRAFATGLDALAGDMPDVVIKLDADVSFEPDYFERLMDAFEADPRLGMASGICTELEDGEWRPLHGTRSHVWGAARSYRRECLPHVLPLEERQGWDEIDAIRAQIAGWTVGTLAGLPFRHHRPEGQRDGMRRRWADQGDTAHFMGYRVSYLLVRTAYRLPRDPAAAAMVWGYARAAARRRPRCDAAVREHLRREQSVGRLPLRIREALGRSA